MDGPPNPVTARPPVVVDVSVEDGCDAPGGDAARWARLLAGALAAEGVAPGAVASLSFVAAATMADLNADHMGGVGPTDVLAFPIDGRQAAPGTGSDPPGLVGDLVVCPEVAVANAPEHAGTPDDEIALLVVHGALHLVGHDHAEPGERAAMQARERALLARLHGPLARDPWVDRADGPLPLGPEPRVGAGAPGERGGGDAVRGPHAEGREPAPGGGGVGR